jgi:hypothetical protein
VSKIDLATIESLDVLSKALLLETEAKWYSSTLSAMLCQQGFLFDSLGQYENAKLCFAAASQMLPVRGNISISTQEPLLKMILRNRVLAERTGSAIESLPEAFDQIPGLQKSFKEHSFASATAAKNDEISFMNITGWLAFCAKIRVHVFFPLLIRSKCISCFMECAKRSFGNTLLLSFHDFCDCLLLLKDAGMQPSSTKTCTEMSEAARVAEVAAFLQIMDFFALNKPNVQRKFQKKYLGTECGRLTVDVELPILRSVFENESETWSLNCCDIMVRGTETEQSLEDGSEKPCLLVKFRAPFDFAPPVQDESLSSHVSSALVLLTAQVSSVAFACSCLKLNRPALAGQCCSQALKFMAVQPNSNSVISDRFVQIISIARIQDALCSSDRHKARLFFNRYQHEMRLLCNSRKDQKKSERGPILKLQCKTSYDEKVLGIEDMSCHSQGILESHGILTDGKLERVNRTQSASIRPQVKANPAKQSSQIIPDLPAEIIRLACSHIFLSIILTLCQKASVDPVMHQQLETSRHEAI